MITWVTTWFLVVCVDCKMNWANTYSVPNATQEICLKRADKLNKEGQVVAKCVFGQLPVYKGDKK